jgi:hypothetical protein
MNTIGKRVKFTENRKKVRGVVEDAISHLEIYDDRDFLDLIQYIRWDNDTHHSIRICYYVRPHGSGEEDWIFANRPLSITTDEFEKLLKKARRKKWFPQFS